MKPPKSRAAALLLLELTAFIAAMPVRLPTPDVHPPVLRFTAVNTQKPAEHDLPELDLHGDPYVNGTPRTTGAPPADYVARFQRFGMDL